MGHMQSMQKYLYISILGLWCPGAMGPVLCRCWGNARCRNGGLNHCGSFQKLWSWREKVNFCILSGSDSASLSVNTHIGNISLGLLHQFSQMPRRLCCDSQWQTASIVSAAFLRCSLSCGKSENVGLKHSPGYWTMCSGSHVSHQQGPELWHWQSVRVPDAGLEQWIPRSTRHWFFLRFSAPEMTWEWYVWWC